MENWDTLPQRIKDLKKQGTTKAKKTKKAAATLANQTVAAKVKESSRTRQTMRDMDIDRTFINYGDTVAEQIAIDAVVESLVSRGKVVEINRDNVKKHGTNGKWVDWQAARDYLKNFGDGYYFTEDKSEAYNWGSNHVYDERVKMVKEYVKELGGSVFTAYDNNGNAVDVHLVEWSKKFKNKSGRIVNVNKDLTSYLKNEVKQEAIALVDELVLASTYDGPEPATHPHDWVDNNGQNDWDVWTTYIQDKKTPSGRQNYELPIPQTVRKSCMIFIQ